MPLQPWGTAGPQIPRGAAAPQKPPWGGSPPPQPGGLGGGSPQNEAGVWGAATPQGWRPVWDKQDASPTTRCGPFPNDTGVCVRNPMNSKGLRPWMSPNHLNLYGLVTSMAPSPINFIGFQWAFISQTLVTLGRRPKKRQAHVPCVLQDLRAGTPLRTHLPHIN